MTDELLPVATGQDDAAGHGTRFDEESELMFIERLLKQGNAPLLEQLVRFTAKRHALIAENMANISVPDYRQKDLSVERFNEMLQERVSERRESPPGSVDFSNIELEIEKPTRNILFHDGNNRSMEQLSSDQAKNALLHNLAVELLRKQYQSIESALKERIS